MWKYIAGTIAVGSVTYNLYHYFAGGVCKCPTRLDGLVVVITGANSGIGKALALELAQRGATIVLACRDIEKGINAKREILSKLNNKNAKLFVKPLNLASVASIVKFSETLKSEFEEIYALVNNAGIYYHPHTITEDGYEITFQTNYLGHFVLTHNLLNLLKKADHSRIVNVTSEAHKQVNSYDLNAIAKSQTEFRSHSVAYGVTKLALILFTRYLSKKLLYTNIIVNAADPGTTKTDLLRYSPYTKNQFLHVLLWPIRFLLVKSPRQGAQSLLHCLLTSNRSTGQLYANCKLALPSALASDDKLAQDYYELTLQILDNKFNTESEC